MTDKYIDHARQIWDNEGIHIYTGSNTYKLLNTFLSQYSRLEESLSDVEKAHHIATAKDDNLDKIGYMVNLRRKTGESNEKYRARIQTQFRLNFTGSSYDEITEFVLTLLQVSPDDVSFDVDLDSIPGTITIRGQESLFNQGILTPTEISEFAEQVAPGGHRVILEQEGSFILKGDGDTDDPTRGLTGDGITTGGRLAGDI